jgi:hypothetical protein
VSAIGKPVSTGLPVMLAMKTGPGRKMLTLADDPGRG